MRTSGTETSAPKGIFKSEDPLILILIGPLTIFSIEHLKFTSRFTAPPYGILPSIG